MTNMPNDPFDPRAFLEKVGSGKTISHYRKDQIIFAQGDVADAVFYVQTGRVKVVVLSEQGDVAPGFYPVATGVWRLPSCTV